MAQPTDIASMYQQLITEEHPSIAFLQVTEEIPPIPVKSPLRSRQLQLEEWQSEVSAPRPLFSTPTASKPNFYQVLREDIDADSIYSQDEDGSIPELDSAKSSLDSPRLSQSSTTSSSGPPTPDTEFPLGGSFPPEFVVPEFAPEGLYCYCAQCDHSKPGAERPRLALTPQSSVTSLRDEVEAAEPPPPFSRNASLLRAASTRGRPSISSRTSSYNAAPTTLRFDGLPSRAPSKASHRIETRPPSAASFPSHPAVRPQSIDGTRGDLIARPDNYASSSTSRPDSILEECFTTIPVIPARVVSLKPQTAKKISLKAASRRRLNFTLALLCPTQRGYPVSEQHPGLAIQA